MQMIETRMQNMENQLGQIAKALSEESERSHPSDTKAQPEETNRDDHVSESDCEGGNMMDDTFLDAFEDPDENSVNESWDAFMGSDTESGGEVVNFHDICEEEEDFSMVQFDYEDESFILHFCADEGYEDHVLPSCADEGYEDHVLTNLKICAT
ncbi:unnamed protein product [Cuscuta epithymum]|nr:unnamed protein product [Cuscuta epithymum]